jgi:hypothetical protein
MYNRIPGFLRGYLWLLAGSLLVQGIVALGFALARQHPPTWTSTALTTHPLHSMIHIVWGLAMLILLGRGLRDRAVALLGVTFGVFYILLALLFVVVDHPLGMTIEPSQNAFHFVVGPLAFILSFAALRLESQPAISTRKPMSS